MSSIKTFEEIEAWKKARELTRIVYSLSNDGAFRRDFGLCNQIRRAAVSIMSNIAEGFERGGSVEFRQFLAIAKGSAGEVEAQLYVALDQKYITEHQFTTARNLTITTKRLIGGLMNYLKQSDLRGHKYRK